LGDALAREQHEQWAEAADLVNRILQKKPGGRLEEAARQKLPYLSARRDAQARFDSGDYAGAAELDRKALQADPFAVSAALQSVDSYLIADRLSDAVELLKAMRTRGDSQSVDNANRMLKELAPVSPQAAKELESPAPPPPPIEEMFAELRAASPDPQSGKRYLAANPLDLTRWTKDLKMEVAMPTLLAITPPPAAAVAPAPTPDAPIVTEAKPLDIFHLEVVPTAETRNLRIRRPTAPEEFGFVEFSGTSSPIVYEGTQQVLPAKLKLPVGKYEIRAVDEGKVVSTQDIEVKPLSTQGYQVKRP